MGVLDGAARNLGYGRPLKRTLHGLDLSHCRAITGPGRHPMIVGCHTHVWQSPDQLGQLVLGDMFRHSKNRPARPSLAAPVMRSIPSADADHHWSQSGTVDKAIVLGFKSRYL